MGPKGGRFFFSFSIIELTLQESLLFSSPPEKLALDQGFFFNLRTLCTFRRQTSLVSSLQKLKWYSGGGTGLANAPVQFYSRRHMVCFLTLPSALGLMAIRTDGWGMYKH